MRNREHYDDASTPLAAKALPLIGMLSSTTCIRPPRMLSSSLAALLLSSSSSRVHGGWIDEDTPPHLRSTTSLVDGSVYDLVMSDEFNVPGRTFADGHDPTWTALDKSDDDYSASGGGSLHFYNSTTVATTDDGMLTIRSILDETQWTHYDAIKREYAHETKHFKSGMIQSWDKFCFTGGIVEVDVILPGEPDIGGLWPAIWLLGNLGRATYEVSTNNLWPWSYDDCDREKQQSQAISGCNSVNHFGLNPKQGRGATEIDILELMAGETGVLPSTYPPISLPYVDMTLQVRVVGLPFVCCWNTVILPSCREMGGGGHTIMCFSHRILNQQINLKLYFLSSNYKGCTRYTRQSSTIGIATSPDKRFYTLRICHFPTRELV